HLDCEDVWRRAASSCIGFLFQTYEWQSAWCRTTGRLEKVDEYIVHLSDGNGQTLFLIPFGLRRRHFCSTLEFLGGPSTDYNAPLISPDFLRMVSTVQEFSRVWRAIVRLLPKVDLIWLTRMPATLGEASNPMLKLPGPMHSNNAYHTRLPNSFEEFVAARGARFFTKNDKALRRLARLGDVKVSLAQSESEIAENIDAMVRQKSRWMRDNGHSDLFATSENIAFYRALSGAPIDDGRLAFASMRVGDQVVATNFGFVHKRRYYNLVMSRQEGVWEPYGVGRLVLEWMVRWCIAEQEIDVFDLTIGDEAFKLRWTDACLPLHDYLEARTIRGTCLVFYRRAQIRWRNNRRVRKLRLLVSGLPRYRAFPKRKSAKRSGARASARSRDDLP
ncbi:MAG: GNAT family N-acetyltransferase, partial [Alphaproteobacteria bacterium]|nr:GNAT family N-acetyltransferase [Alphaproteobacteria bacterium]